MSKWRALTLQEKAAGIQDVTYQTDQQTLILNTATAYFNVLNAIDVLSYTQAQKEAIYRQLDQTTQRFNVGLGSDHRRAERPRAVRYRAGERSDRT